MMFTNVFTGLGMAKAYAEPIVDSAEKSGIVENNQNVNSVNSTTPSAIRFEKTEVAKGENIKIFFTSEHKWLDCDLIVYSKENKEKAINTEYEVANTEDDGNAEIEYDTSNLEEGEYTFKVKVYDPYDGNFEQEYSTEQYVKVNEVKEENDVSVSEDIDKAIEGLKNYFETFDGGYSEKYDYKISMALRRSGTAVDKIDAKKNVYTMFGVNNYARNIMTLIASGNSPEQYVDNLLRMAMKFYDDENSEYVANAILALDMAGAEYDEEAAVKALIAKGNDEGNNMLSFGEKTTEDDGFGYYEDVYYLSTETTAIVMTALANHRDVEGVNETIVKIKNYLKSLKHESGLIKEKSAWSEEDSVAATSAVIQALIMIEENPLSDEWISTNSKGEKVNMVQGILSCKEGEQFKDSPSSSSVNNEVSSDAMLAFIDLKEGNSTFKELKYNEIPKVVKVEIQGEEQINLVDGDETQLQVKAYDKNSELINDAEIKWVTTDEKVVVVQNGKITAIAAGTVNITACLKDDDNISDSIIINVEEKLDNNEELKAEINKAIEDVKAYFEKYDGKFSDTYDYKIAMGLRRAGTSVDKIDELKNIYGMSGVNNDARNIMTLIASGNNPKNYKGKNYVDSLLNASKKFYKEDDSEAVAKAIIALEMADAEYEKEVAIKELISKANDEGNNMISFGQKSFEEDWDGNWEEVYYPSTEGTALVLTALSCHRDIEGTDETIIKIKNYFKSLKHESGLIKAKSTWSEEESASATSAVIQALIALEEDPLSDEWSSQNSEGKKTNMVEGLLSCKKGEKFGNTPDSTGEANLRLQIQCLL